MTELTSRQKLNRLQELKNEVIKKDTGLSYMTEKDFEYIAKQDDKLIDKFIVSLENLAYKHNNNIQDSGDDDHCFWCFKGSEEQTFNNKCDGCNYKENNKKCGDTGSRYDEILYKIKSKKRPGIIGISCILPEDTFKQIGIL